MTTAKVPVGKAKAPAGAGEADVLAVIDGLIAEARAGAAPLWRPIPGPQAEAYDSPADELLFGGAVGGGKTDLLLGLAFTRHRRSLILRREYTQLTQIIDRAVELAGTTKGLNRNEHVFRLPGRVIQFGAMEQATDWQKWQGRPFDLLAFDELTQFLEQQYLSLTAWNRTTRKGQRLRVVAASNPPVTPAGRWVYKRWAPWLDPHHPDPARPGEVRYFVTHQGEERRVDGPGPVTLDGITYLPVGRTFIPARLSDNPYLNRPDYLSRLQALPEPLRSQLLYGDWQAGLEDDANQVIPHRWVQAAMRRLPAQAPDGGLSLVAPLDQVGVDVARGGRDATVIARRRGRVLLPLIVIPGRLTPDGPSVAAAVIDALEPDARAGTTIVVDATGVGAAVVDILRQHPLLHPGQVVAWNAAARTFPATRDRTGRFTFANDRSHAWWLLREALEPDTGLGLILPPDEELLAELTAPIYTVRAGGAILVESKDQIRGRLGRSTDRADALILACAPVLLTPDRTAARPVVLAAPPADPLADAGMVPSLPTTPALPAGMRRMLTRAPAGPRPDPADWWGGAGGDDARIVHADVGGNGDDGDWDGFWDGG